MTIFISSDPHFSHDAMWKTFQTAAGPKLRSFSSSEEMNDYIVERHNAVVKPSDHWYCLGDVAMTRPRKVAKWLKALHGHRRLVMGNHDIYHAKEYLEFFERISAMRVLDGILLSHMPLHPQSMDRYRANAHGHIHEGPNLTPAVGVSLRTGNVHVMPYINVTVEHLDDYTPVSLDELSIRAAVFASEPTTK
jgi:calcineurin-like phosphoesterase family protein